MVEETNASVLVQNLTPRFRLPRIAITVGEPAGIGPELIAMVAQHAFPAELVAIGDRGLLETRAATLGLSLASAVDHGKLRIEHIPLAVPSQPGLLDVRNVPAVLASLEHAAQGARSGRYDAIVTAPVHKGVINDAGVPFSGHTEFLAERAGLRRVVMMLASGSLRVALVTTHLPLAEVPRAITRDVLTDTLRILRADLVRWFGIANPRILVAGLNPHAGESGHLGREEIDVIVPVLDRLRAEGFDLRGPLPADTLFHPDRLADADCVLAMYHDQGLAPFKYATFGRGVNVTLGLPYIRTSVDHGTALELAGTGKADGGSLTAAIELAIELWRQRHSSNAAPAVACPQLG